MEPTSWLGKDEHNGVPSQRRPDHVDPPGWRLEWVYDTSYPHDLAVSPDGSTISFVLSGQGSCDIHLAPTGGGQARRLTSGRSLAPYWEDSSHFWSPDGGRIAYESNGVAFVIAATGGPPNQLGEYTPRAWLDDERLVVTVDDERTTRLAMVDVADPWPQPFGPTGGDVWDVQPTGDGRVLTAFQQRDDFNRIDLVIAAPAGDWRVLAGKDDTRTLGNVVRDGQVAYVTEEDDWRAVYLTDLEGTEHRLLAKDRADFGELAWSPGGDRLAATRSHRGKTDLVTITLDGVVEVLAEGGSWQEPVWVGEEIVAVHEAHDSPPRMVRIGAEEETLFHGGPVTAAAARHRPFERITYTGGGGLEIEGFLYGPDDRSSPAPAVVYPHGGPTSAYGDDWDGVAQYFVDKGYVWLAINFRGSTGYGRSFERANHDDWGVGDTLDCLAAGRYLQGLDWVDPDRIAIFGASYGSYMSLTSLVHPDNPFACGVLKYGDCDILTSWAQGDRGGVDDLERMMGHPRTNRAAYRAGSPIHDVDRIDRPLLIVHGEQDARVNVKQAEQLVEELRRLGKSFEYVTYPQEAHGLLRRESNLHFNRRLERFLDWHLI